MINKQPKLGVAVVGLGVGEQHLLTYRRHPRCTIVALCDQSKEKIALAQEKYADIPFAREAESVLVDPNVDVVSIASYDDDHFAQILIALQHGKHVFVEKPLCQTLDQLRTIKNEWVRHGGKLKLASNLILRAAPAYRWLKEKVSTGELGEVYAFDGDYLYGRLHKITEGWRGRIENYSVMEGGGIHLIDLMLWITNQRPSIVSTMGNRIASRETQFRYNDFVTAMMQFPSKMIARVTANFGCVHRHHHVVRIFGTRATFIYDDAGPRLHTTRDASVTASSIILPTLSPTKGDLIPNFIDAILADSDLNNDTQAIFDGLSISIACDKAMSSGKMETIEYI
jgi:predicted dehydrogenase